MRRWANILTLAAFAACRKAPDPTPAQSDASAPAPVEAAAPAPPPPREPGTFAIDCGQTSDPDIAEGSLKLPTPFVFERPDIDAIVHGGTPRYVTEAWKVDPEKGCEHQYQVNLFASSAEKDFEDLAKKLGVAPKVDGSRMRLYADAPREGVPFFVMVEARGLENVFVNILHRGVDVPACMKRAVEMLRPSLRTVAGVVETGAPLVRASIVLEQGVRPRCQVELEWFYDDKIYPKVRAWIEQRGHKIDKNQNFTWDDSGSGYVTKGSATFRTPYTR